MIAQVTCGKMVAKHVCAITGEMPPGVMEKKVFTMIITLRNMERTPLVIAIGVTENVIHFFSQNEGNLCYYDWECEPELRCMGRNRSCK